MAQNTLEYAYDGSDVSRTLQPGRRAFDTVVWQQGKPPLDSELNLLHDVLSDKMQDHVKSMSQSGFVNQPTYVFDPTWSNYFQMTECVAYVNGWRLDVIPFGDSFIQLPAATAGLGNHRWDFVFLEVWKTILVQGSVQHKPSTTLIYKDGNVQNTSGNYTDDIKDPVVPYETSRRVQIQYRIRIQQNVTAPNQQNINIFDASTYAQGGALSPVSPIAFTNQGSATSDYGLWRAGNGDAASRTQLMTVDGYVYAIPLALVFRRANAPYADEDNDGQFASARSISMGSSDRIDGLFYDSVVQNDLIDLRHQVITGTQTDYNKILEVAIQDLLTGANSYRRPSVIKYESISDAPITGYSRLNTNNVCDKTRYIWDDISQTVVSHTVRINVGDTDTLQDIYTSRAVGTWTIGDTITVKAPSGSPAGTVVLGTDDSDPSTKPYVYRNGGAGLINVAGSWSGTGTTTAVFTVNVNLASQEIWIVYDVQYPANQGTSFVSDALQKLEYADAASFPNDVISYVPHAGVVRAGTNLLNNSYTVARNSKQLDFTHDSTFNNYAANFIVNKRTKRIQISPIISSTTAVDGTTRSIYVSNYNSANRRIYLPFANNRMLFVRGVYSGKSSGSELATEQFLSENPALISGNLFQHPTAGYSFAFISSMIYDPSGANVELISASGGNYWPVYRQNSIGDMNQFQLVDSSGAVYVPPSVNPTDYVISHRSIPTAKVGAYTINSTELTDNFIQLRSSVVMVDGTQVWIDVDYIGEPHDGGEVKLAYQYLPYQGLVENTGFQLFGKVKALSGFVHSDGTGNVSSNIDLLKYPRALSTYLPTPLNTERLLDGSSVSGVGSLGKYITSDVCYAKAEVLDYSSTIEQPLKINDIVSGMFNGALVSMERGGNQATSVKSAMLLPLSVAAEKQAVIFALVSARTNLALQNELILYVWTFTDNSADNKLSSGDGLHVGVDFFFINNRPLVKFD